MNDRPVGITILCILHFLGGVGLLVLQLFFSNNLNQLSNNLGYSSVLILISVLFLGLIAIMSSVGMWLGKPWGWWLGAFYYLYAIARYGNSLIAAFQMSEQLSTSPRGATYFISRDIGRIIVHGLIVLYFFKENVIRYFMSTNFSKKKAASILAGSIFGFIIVASLGTFIWLK